MEPQFVFNYYWEEGGRSLYVIYVTGKGQGAERCAKSRVLSREDVKCGD